MDVDFLCCFHSIRFAQSAGPVFYRFGSLFESIFLLEVTFGGPEMQLSGPKTDFGAQGAP